MAKRSRSKLKKTVKNTAKAVKMVGKVGRKATGKVDGFMSNLWKY